MGDAEVFLRPNSIIEPLTDGFYAWLHTVAPVQAAMNLAFMQIPLLESYLQSPQVHINASRNPALRGSFFVNVQSDRGQDVRDLLAAIKRDRADMLAFAAAVSEALFTKPVTKKMSDSRTLSGSTAAQAAAIMTELGAAEAYVYAMGEEEWLGHIMATTYNEDSYALKQIGEFMAWCAEHGIKSDHLYGQHEWRW